MKKRIISFYILLATSLLGCEKFEEFQTDPNKTTQATPDLLLANIEQKAFNTVDIDATLAARQAVYTDGVSSSQYYGWTRSGYGDYNNLRQVLKLEAESKRLNKGAYLALSKFFRSYFITNLTLTFGDVPYSEALSGEDGAFTPVYDKQQDIFLQVLNDLKEANTLLSTTTESISGDIIYSGDISKWRKLINSFSLRVLTHLSQKENNSQLNIKQRFAEIVNNPSLYPLFANNSDNAKLTFFDIQGNRYPYFNSNSFQTAYYMEESFVNMLKGFQDPRLFKFADKAPRFSALPETDFNAYGGVMGSATISENNSRAVAGEASKIDARYYTNPVNEPSNAVTYAELQFILAEAVSRNWITGSMDTYYKNGVQASMEFYGIDQVSINSYISQPAVQLEKGNELQAIITQKYISSFLNTGWLPFFENRRTGFPAFDVSGTGVLNNKKIPKRWMYPEEELKLNEKNVTDAISRQYQVDEINGTMWILVKE